MPPDIMSMGCNQELVTESEAYIILLNWQCFFWRVRFRGHQEYFLLKKHINWNKGEK